MLNRIFITGFQDVFKFEICTFLRQELTFDVKMGYSVLNTGYYFFGVKLNFDISIC